MGRCSEYNNIQYSKINLQFGIQNSCIAGISDFQVIYQHGADLPVQLTILLSEIIKTITTAPAAGG
jgi:hypothetical protein